MVSVVRNVSELRERFRVGNLVLNEEIEAMSPNTDTVDDGRTFARQMQLVDVPERERRSSVYDYYRAFEQRSRWARENLLLPAILVAAQLGLALVAELDSVRANACSDKHKIRSNFCSKQP